MHLIDLTYDLEEGMPTFNAHWHVPFEMTQLGRHGFEGRETRKITFGTHTGTQVDAPLHFIKEGKSIETIPLEKMIGPVTITDFSFLGENGVVTTDMLTKVALSKRMLFKFGWGIFWNTKRYYQGYPFFSEAAAQYLVSKGVELVALDTCSPDDSRVTLQGDILGSDKDSPIHKIFLRNGIVLVEYVAHVDQISDYNNWNIIVMPLRLKGADGSPARVCIYRENHQEAPLTAAIPPAKIAKLQSGVSPLPGVSTVTAVLEKVPEKEITTAFKLADTSKKKYRVEYDRPGCIGAGSCVAVQPERWVILDEQTENKADLRGGHEEKPGLWVLEFSEEEFEQFRSAATMCPVQVIKLFNIETGEQLTW